MTTPSKFFFCARNLVDDSTITTTDPNPENQQQPLANMKLSSRARVWRPYNDNIQDLIFSFANTTSQRVNFAALYRHNFETAATWRVRLYTTYDASGAASYDSGDIAALSAATLGDLDFGVEPLGGRIFNGFPRFSVFYFMENTATVINSVRISISDNGNSANYIEVSRAYIGKGIELTHNWENVHCNWNEGSKHERTDGGSIQTDGVLGYRELQADLKWLAPTDRAEVMDGLRYAGMRRDWFLSAYPGVGGEVERDHTLIARVSSMPKLSTLFYDMYSSQLKFAEI